MSRQKSPAFQFYPQDYLSSARVAVMTLEEEGAYIRLLCYCWSTGSIPADPDDCARLAGKGCSTSVATNVQRSFNEDPTDPSRLVHDRLDLERQNQHARREQASSAGKKSAESRAKKAEGSPPKESKTPGNKRDSNGRSTDVQRNVNTSSSSSSSSSDIGNKQINKGAVVKKFGKFVDLPELPDGLAATPLSDDRLIALLGEWWADNGPYVKERDRVADDVGGAVVAFRAKKEIDPFNLTNYVATALNRGVLPKYTKHFKKMRERE